MYNKAQTLELIKSASDRFPDRRNPQNSGNCLYTAVDDPEVHCIAGQVIADLNGPVPDCDMVAPLESLVKYPDDFGGTELATWMKATFTEDGRKLLDRAQSVYDHMEEGQTHPVKWGLAWLMLQSAID